MKHTRESIGNHPYFTYSVGGNSLNQYDLHFEEGEIAGVIDASDLNVKFFETLFEPWNTSFDLDDFLDYQYENTEYPKKDFINHIRHVIYLNKKVHYSEKKFNEHQDDIQERVFAWINKKYDILSQILEVKPVLLNDRQIITIVRVFFEELRDSQDLEINDSDLVRLTHAITGRHYNGVQNSSFHSNLKRGFKNKSSTTVAQELKTIEELLRSLELNKLLPFIYEKKSENVKDIKADKELKTSRLKK